VEIVLLRLVDEPGYPRSRTRAGIEVAVPDGKDFAQQGVAGILNVLVIHHAQAGVFHTHTADVEAIKKSLPDLYLVLQVDVFGLLPSHDFKVQARRRRITIPCWNQGGD